MTQMKTVFAAIKAWLGKLVSENEASDGIYRDVYRLISARKKVHIAGEFADYC